MTLLSTTSLSGSTTTISGISQSYTDLRIVIQNPYTGVGGNWSINPNGTAFSFWESGVDGPSVYYGTSRNLPNFGGRAASQTSYPSNQVATMNIMNYTNTTYGKNFILSGNTNNDTTAAFIFGGVINTTSAITSISFTCIYGPDSWSGGQVLIYGVK
jgi:hypothetical protein